MQKLNFKENFNNITDLCNLKGRVYVELVDEEQGSAFLRQAESEGFTFCDGAQPTSRSCGRVMAVNPDKTINYVGAVGMTAYGCAEKAGNTNLIRILY